MGFTMHLFSAPLLIATLPLSLLRHAGLLGLHSDALASDFHARRLRKDKLGIHEEFLKRKS